MSTRALKISLYGSVVLIGAVAALLLYWQYQPSQVLKFTKPLTVKTQINQGGYKIVILLATYCKLQDVKGTVRTSFVTTGAEIFQPIEPENQPKGCHTDLDVPVVVPMVLPPGEYSIKFRVMYQLNPVKSEVEELNTDQFQVQ